MPQQIHKSAATNYTGLQDTLTDLTTRYIFQVWWCIQPCAFRFHFII